MSIGWLSWTVKRNGRVLGLRSRFRMVDASGSRAFAIGHSAIAAEAEPGIGTRSEFVECGGAAPERSALPN